MTDDHYMVLGITVNEDFIVLGIGNLRKSEYRRFGCGQLAAGVCDSSVTAFSIRRIRLRGQEQKAR